MSTQLSMIDPPGQGDVSPKRLRPHQDRAIALLRDSLTRGRRRPVLQAPTGFGKTVLAAEIILSALSKGKRVIFCVPAVSLINQTVESFWAQGIDQIGVIQADHPLTNFSKPVQVASIQTLQKRKIPHADLVIVDECHRVFKFYNRWFSEWNNVPFVGLSATPWTKGLGKLYDDLLIASTTQDLISQGYLSDFRVYAPSKPDLSKCRTVAGDWHEGDIGDVMDKPGLTADIVSTWKRMAEGRPTLAFCVNRAHANHLRKDFESRGVKADYIDAYTDVNEREIIAKKFHRGETQVVCNVGCLTTGVDWDVRCVILARPTKSEMLFVQIVGRGLRTADGKQDCLILDHSDTHQRLGFVTDIHHEKLDDGRQNASTKFERKQPLPKECPSCKYMKPAKVHQCPSCGFKAEKQSDIEVQDGDLSELKRKKKLNRDVSSDEKKKFYGELLGYCQNQGYKRGWAANKYRDRFGVWPNAHHDAIVSDPSLETINYIKHSLIKWARGKANHANC